MACQRYLIRGRVQGVWYRVSAQRQAVGLGLLGQARNLSDGRVEVIACGETTALDRFESWLWRGPQQARVEDVAREETPERHFEDFSIA